MLYFWNWTKWLAYVVENKGSSFELAEDLRQIVYRLEDVSSHIFSQWSYGMLLYNWEFCNL